MLGSVLLSIATSIAFEPLLNMDPAADVHLPGFVVLAVLNSQSDNIENYGLICGHSYVEMWME